MLLKAVVAAVLLVHHATADEMPRTPTRALPGPGQTELLRGPNATVPYTPWMAAMMEWRESTRAALGLPVGASAAIATEYPEVVDWVTSSIVQPQVHIYDRFLYNDTLGVFTPDRYLDDLKVRYGGVDSVMLWAGYPNVGIE